MVVALALAERGEQVVLVDPDAGPPADGSWPRRGVMQFLHPHFFRHHVRRVLEERVPTMWDAVVAAGGVVNDPLPGMPPSMTTLACRRSTFEAALRRALEHDRIRVLTGFAESVVVQRDRVAGLVVDGGALAVDRVVASHGRRGDLGEQWRPPVEGGPCGQSYVSRMYQTRPGVEPLRSWLPHGARYDGYEAIAFPQDAGTMSALVVRASDDPRLEMLWDTAAFEAAVAAIPNLAPWTDPAASVPLTPVMRGGTLTNTYRGQGTPPAGLLFVGDAVCTTNPSAGRGVTLGLWQAEALLDALEVGDDRDASRAFDAWCEAQVRPWFADHLVEDDWIVRRYAGEDLDPEGVLPSGVAVDAAAEHDGLMPAVQQYLAMHAPPSSLAAVEDEVRGLVRGGWRPGYAEGPGVGEIVDLVAAAR